MVDYFPIALRKLNSHGEEHTSSSESESTSYKCIDEVDDFIRHPFVSFLLLQSSTNKALHITCDKCRNSSHNHGRGINQTYGPSVQWQKRPSHQGRCSPLSRHGSFCTGFHSLQCRDQKGCLSVTLSYFGGERVGQFCGQRCNVS